MEFCYKLRSTLAYWLDFVIFTDNRVLYMYILLSVDLHLILCILLSLLCCIVALAAAASAHCNASLVDERGTGQSDDERASVKMCNKWLKRHESSVNSLFLAFPDPTPEGKQQFGARKC